MAKRIVGITLETPVLKSDASGDAIEVGDTLGLRVHQAVEPGDGDVYQDVTVTNVTDGSRGVFWDFLTTNLNPLDVAAIDSDHNPA